MSLKNEEEGSIETEREWYLKRMGREVLFCFSLLKIKEA